MLQILQEGGCMYLWLFANGTVFLIMDFTETRDATYRNGMILKTRNTKDLHFHHRHRRHFLNHHHFLGLDART